MSSIREVGLLQPIIVRPADGFFEVIAGNRRMDACKRLRWKQIPAIVQELSDKEAYEVCLTENLQKQTMSPLEEAEAFQSYVERHRWGSISELARKIGKSEVYVSHRLLLLNLPGNIIEKISTRVLNPSIGRELVWITDHELQQDIAKVVEENSLSVRETHRLIDLTRSGTMNIGEAVNYIRPYEGPGFEQPAGGTAVELDDSYGRSLERMILILRMALIRIDRIIEETRSDEARDLLVKNRLAVHSMIDDCVRSNKEHALPRD
jgi:ParB family chromosome partitioning protein